MIIKDEGFVLGAQKYGEKALIVSVFSLSKGKIVGFSSDGKSKRMRGVFEVGNKIFFEASSRLEENMKRLFRVELIEPNAVNMMTDFKKLELMTAVVPLMQKVLNENEEVYPLYEVVGNFFGAKDLKEMLMWYAYFEFYLLEYLGVGLNLECCAVRGVVEDLAFVSPKTGKAVCFEVGRPYQGRLFKYPKFVVDKSKTPSINEIFDVLRLTEHFLKANFFKFHNMKMPESRDKVWQILEAEMAAVKDF